MIEILGMRTIKRLAVSALLALAPGLALSAPEYDVIDLGTLGGTYSAAVAINDPGTVVGESTWTNGETHAFIWSNGVMSRLLAQAWITNSSALDINESGHVAGLANTSNGIVQAFLLSGATLTHLGVFPGGDYSVARALNDIDMVAGQSHTTNVFGTNPHAFRWTNGVLADLGTLDVGNAYSSEAYDIDNAGRVVGFAFHYCPVNCWDPFIWVDANTNGLREYAEMIPLGTFGGVFGQACGINEIGQVVGHATLSWYSIYHAFLVTPVNGAWYSYGNPTQNQYMVDLGTLGGTNSYGWAINDAGIVVGSSELADGSMHAYIYDGGMTDLNSLIPSDSGWTLNVARAINSSGHIVGYGNSAGQTRGFLLVPASNRVDLTRIEMTPDSATSSVSLFWAGRGSNLRFTVETAENTTSATWQAVEPANQWPIQSLFWSDSSPLVSSTGVFRVRAASYQ